MDTTNERSRDDSYQLAGQLLHHEERPESTVEPTWRDVSNQIIACCVCSLIVVQVGLNMSFSAVLLPDLENSESGYKISKDEASWIASLLVLFTPIGSLLSGPISDKLGRKKTIMLTCFPMFLAWIFFALCPENNVLVIYVARVLAGLAGGMTTTFIVYVSEVCHEKYRPMLLGLNSSAVSLGVLIVSACGTCLHWKTMAALYAVLSIISLILIGIYAPESPHWLMILSKKINRLNKTEQALKRLNPNTEIHKKKLQQILTASKKIDETTINQREDTKFVKKVKRNLLNFLLRETLLPVLILMGLIMFQQLSGGYAIIFYTIHIFKKLGGKFGDSLDEYDAFLFMGVIRFMISIVSAGLSRAVGRRPLLFISSFGMAVSCFCVTIYVHYFFTKSDNNSSIEPVEVAGHWFPLVCLLTYVCMSAIGLLNIPWTMMGELLPTYTRSVGTGFLISFAYIIMFIDVKIYPFLLDSLNVGTLFLAQGIICLITIVFVFIYVPETLGKSLNEIEKYFSKKSEETL